MSAEYQSNQLDNCDERLMNILGFTALCNNTIFEIKFTSLLFSPYTLNSRVR